MDKDAIAQSIETIFSEFPDAGEELSVVLQEFLHRHRRQLALQVGNEFIIAILHREFFKKIRKNPLQLYAQTLKELSQPSRGRNLHLPHLKHLHGMALSYHFRALHKHGLIKQPQRGVYDITENGWQVIERAFKISRMKPLEDEDYKKYSDIIK